jgi:hypothetical protein
MGLTARTTWTEATMPSGYGLLFDRTSLADVRRQIDRRKNSQSEAV